MQPAREIAFGKFRLDLTNECLWQGARAISLRPKAFAVLKLLVEHPGLLVTKQQVLDTVWPGTFVGDAVLKDNVRQLREALHDDAGSPVYIETAHRRGYRFIGKLTEAAPIKNPTAPAQMPLSQLPPNTAALTSPAIANTVLGRDSELTKMRSWLERAVAGERQTVFITGEPGIGKTTIVQAFLEQAAQVPGILVARGQCLEHYGAGEAYLPVLDGFSRVGRSAEGAKVLPVLRQHAPAWLSQMPSLVPQSERASLQAQVVGATRERMLREMAGAIETLTSESPLILVLEDLHWSDYSTLDLVSYLARRQDSARLMVIGTYRPVDVILGDHPLKGVKRELQAHGLCHELPLEFLSEDTVGSYLATRFPGHEFAPRFRRAIHRRTEGNPLFIVNLVEYLSDQKMIGGNKQGWELKVDLSEIERGIPANLRQLIEKQIERLSPDERAVLEAASVAGMECSCVAIAAGLEMPIEWVEKHCEELARRHQFLSASWLAELPDGTVTPRHRFIHILYRDVPYRLMPAMRRSQIHQRIGERGLAIYGNRSNEIASELAMHFEQSRDWARALHYLSQAAENATRKSAHHEAADLAQRGLVVLKLLPGTAERDQQEIALRMILIISLMAVKGFAWAGVEEVYAEGKDLFRLSKPSAQLFNVRYLLGLFYIIGGKIKSALEISNELLQLAEGLKDSTLAMEAHRAMGSSQLEMGRCTEAIEHFDRVSQLYASNRHLPYTLTIGHDCKVLCECCAGRALWALGFPDAGLERMQGGVTLARQLSHPQTLVAAAHCAADLHGLRGEPLLAQERAREALRLAEEYDLELWVAFGKIDLGSADAELGNIQQGIEEMQQGVAAYEATGGKLWLPYFLGLLANTLGKEGRIEEGLAVIAKALTMGELNSDAFAMPELHRIKGELLLNSSHLLRGGKLPSDSSRVSTLSEARASFNDALSIAKQQGTRSWELRAALGMHRLDLMVGSPDHTRLAEIFSSFTEGFETVDLKQARARLNTASVL
jgi:DNA-binding winged helix-turn-helix (wHTH) protein/predicted ATPase